MPAGNNYPSYKWKLYARAKSTWPNKYARSKVVGRVIPVIIIIMDTKIAKSGDLGP